eukprot:5530809-Prorocentrum_lima.AAC.1
MLKSPDLRLTETRDEDSQPRDPSCPILRSGNSVEKAAPASGDQAARRLLEHVRLVQKLRSREVAD